MSKDLLYQPQIGYKKSYYTEGTFEDTNVVVPSSNTNENTNIPVINNLINTIDKNLKWIPQAIKETYLSPYVALKDEYNRLSDYEPTDIDTNDPVIVPSTIDDDDDFPSDPFSKGTDIYIDVQDQMPDRVNFIGDKYYVDFMDIYKDYLEKVNNMTQNYIYTSLAALGMTDKNHNLDSYDSVDIKNKNLTHLSDYLTKSSISFDQTIRLHKKLFDMDATILHVRGIRLGENLVKRYYGIEKLESNNDLSVTSNVLLNESRKVADKKYKENFYALYKYLNSSVILMNESIQTLTKQNKSILTINKYEERD